MKVRAKRKRSVEEELMAERSLHSKEITPGLYSYCGI